MKRTMIYIMIFIALSFGANKFEYAKVKVSGPDDLKFMNKYKIDIDRTSFQGKDKGFPEYLKVYIDQERFEVIEKEGYAITWEPMKLPKDATDFRYNEDIGDSMLVWQNRYPAICKRIQIGTSVEGRELWVLKISDNVNIEEAEPEVKFVSTMHGDEVTGVEMEMYMIEDILYGYQANNDTMQFIVNNTELYVMPLMNPDGMANNSRYNANYIDLNRDFPDFLTGETNLAEPDEPEIDAMINWSNDHNFILSTNYHGGALVANYILDTKPPLTSYQYAEAPDDLHATWLAANYAIRNIPMYNGAFTDGITNGLEWYEAVGGMQDWNYHYYGDMDVTLEISNTKWPAYSEMPGFWQDNRDAMFWYLSAAHKGIYGIVTDYDTGLPLAATIEIGGIDKEYYTDPDFGDYYRILKPGTYTMTVSAPGYTSQIMNNVVVTDDTGSFKEATEVNVQLVKYDQPNISLSETDTIRMNLSPGSLESTNLVIGNTGELDLNYTANVSFPDMTSLILQDNDFESGLDYTNTGTLLWIASSGGEWNSYSNCGILNAAGGGSSNSNQIGELNSRIFDGSVCSEVTLEFDQQFITSGNSSVSVKVFDGAWTEVFIATNSISNHQTFVLPAVSGMQVRFIGNMRNRSGDSWGLDNVVISGPEVNSDPWLTLNGYSSVNNSILYEDSETISIDFDTSGISYGIHTALITIISNDPQEGTILIPVKLTVSDILSAPINVIPDALTSSCSLTWDSVNGATIYNVYRSVDPYSGFSFIGSSATNSYTDNDVPVGNKYFYYVTADNAKK